MKKKIASIILSAVMLTSVMAVGLIASAAGKPTYIVKSAVSGNNVTVTVSIPGNTTAGGKIIIDYNRDNLEYQSISETVIGQFNPDYKGSGMQCLSFFNATNYPKETVLMTITYSIKNGKTKSGDIKVDFFNLYDENSTLVSSSDDTVTPIAFTCPHTSSAWTVKTAATCTAEGVEECKCSVCDEVVETRAITKTAHTDGAWQTIAAPTCTEDGTRVKNCTVCGNETARETIPALGHSFGEWTTVTEATCTAEGLEKRACPVCGTEETRVLPTVPHTPGECTVIKQPTCTENGIKNAVCTVCGEKYTEIIPALGHTADKWEIVKEASCTEAGEKKSVCTVCEETFTEEIPALGHDFGDWKITKEATETEEGSKERICSVCGEKETEVIPKLAASASNSESDVKIPKTGAAVASTLVFGILSAATFASAAVIVKKKNKS